LYGPETKDEHKSQIEKALENKMELKLEVIFYKKNGEFGDVFSDPQTVNRDTRTVKFSFSNCQKFPFPNCQNSYFQTVKISLFKLSKFPFSNCQNFPFQTVKISLFKLSKFPFPNCQKKILNCQMSRLKKVWKPLDYPL
jgi:hypothetical protein